MGKQSRQFFRQPFLGQATGWLAIDIKKKRVFVLEFKRSTDTVEEFLETKEAAANKQHSSIIEVLRAVTNEWVVEQINFIAGTHGSVMESYFYEKLEKLDIQAGKNNKIFSDHLTQVCEAHGQVISSYFQQIHGSPGTDARGSSLRNNIWENVYA